MNNRDSALPMSLSPDKCDSGAEGCAAVSVRGTVSIHIVTYNSAEDIEGCLACVRNQSYPIDKIVVLDNASGDGTPELLGHIGQGLDVVLSPKNTGFAGGQNLVLSRSDADYALVLNPDVRLHPDYVRRLVELLECCPEAGSATGMLVRQPAAGMVDSEGLPQAVRAWLDHLPAEALIDSTGLAIDVARQARDRGAGEPAAAWLQGGETFGVSGAAAMYRRSMIKHISLGGEFFDETFFAYKEDVDVAWRARLLGWTALYEPKARALHARGWKEGDRFAVSPFVRMHSYQNRFYTLLKNERSLLRLPVIAAIEITKLGYILFKERDLLGCWAEIAHKLPEMWAKRRELRNILLKDHQ